MEVLIGRSSINGSFSIAMFDYQRVRDLSCPFSKDPVDFFDEIQGVDGGGWVSYTPSIA